MGLAEKYPVRYTVEDWKSWQGDWELVEGIPYAM
ncbi:MAG: Uma2 family endonuclease, partial [Aquificota bacterium]